LVNSELITGFLNVRSEGFGISKVGNDILKNFGQAYFELCEIHRCPEGAKIGSRQLIVEFLNLYCLYGFLSGRSFQKNHKNA